MILSIATRFPCTVPTFARKSSIVSGFFFWGMMDDVEEYVSASSMNPNSDVLHNISSSAILDILVIRFENADTDSIIKSRLDTASCEFSMSESKPSSSHVNSRSMGKPVEANAAAPSGLLFVRLYAPLSRLESRSSADACAIR